jgi:hypothetical protein
MYNREEQEPKPNDESLVSRLFIIMPFEFVLNCSENSHAGE